ncbi:Fibroleukin [Exaiptasia diaphana]|nr:Fibroleukin [Exaiptasia diaphana]
MTVKTDKECWLKCVSHERCLSLNVIIASKTLQCELFNWIGGSLNAFLVPKKSGYHAQLQVKDDCQGCLNGGACVASKSRYKCTCQFGYKGNRCETQVNQDCSTLLAAGYHENGVYTIHPDGKGEFPVLCDMKTNGGGWVVIQKRFDASVSFNRLWNEYKKGFGEMKTGEFWLGNDYIHRLTEARPMKILIELEDTNGLHSNASYSIFIVQNESNFYRLDISGYSGTAGNALDHSNPPWKSKGMVFSTPDRDNDKCPCACAVDTKSGWWFNWCAAGSLNQVTIFWNTLSNSLSKSTMKIKPIL